MSVVRDRSIDPTPREHGLERTKNAVGRADNLNPAHFAMAWPSRHKVRVCTSDGRICSSPSSASCWPRRRRSELKATLRALAERSWVHPSSGEPVRFGVSTIERWYYWALRERGEPVGSLRRKIRVDAGEQFAISEAVRQALLAQYAAHKGWSGQLHYDNLVALAESH